MFDDPAATQASRHVAASAPFFIVFNLKSGHRDRDETLAAIDEVLRGAGRECHVFDVEDPRQLGDVIRHAVAQAQAQQGVVVAAGGDGTINTVTQSLLGTGCVLGVLPLGTFNFFSRTYGIPSEIRDAAAQLLADRAYPAQVGQVNDRVFIVNASLGLYPQLLQEREHAKRYFARSRFVAFWSGLLTLLREHRQLLLRIDDGNGARRLRTPTLFVGNNRLQLERIGIDESAAVDSGRLAAIAPRPVGTLALLWLALRGALGRLGDEERISSFAFDKLDVRPYLPYGRRRVKIAIDGEITWMRTPLLFRVAPEPVYLLRPEHVGEDPG